MTLFGSRSKLAVSLGVLLLVLALAACGGGQSPAPSNTGGSDGGSDAPATGGSGGDGVTTYQMGVAMPLTGDQADIGLDFVRFMEMAVDEVNEAYAEHGIQLEMLSEDTQAQAEIDVAVLSKLATVNNVPITFTAWSSVVHAMGPVADDLQVLVVNNGANSPELAGAAEFLLNFFPLASLDVSKLAEYTYEELGKRRAAIIYLDNATGIGAADIYEEVFTSLGGEVVAKESIRPGAVDASAQIAKVKAANPDVLHIHALAETAVIIKAAEDAGLGDILKSSYSASQSPSIRNSAGAAMNGLIYTSLVRPLNDEKRAFLERFKERYGQDAAMLGYMDYMHDSPFLYAELIKYLREQGKEVTGANLKEAALTIKEFDLPFLGSIEFQDDGTLITEVMINRVTDATQPTDSDETIAILK